MEVRKDRDQETNRNDRLDTGVAFAAVHSQALQQQVQKQDDEKLSLFWRVFGGTILSICALVGITVYNNMAGSISELRNEISRINEARSDLIKKDEFNSRLTQAGTQLQTLQSSNNTHNASLTSMQTAISELKDQLKERLASAKTDADALRKESQLAMEAMRKDEAKALDAMKKDQALINDSVKKDLATLDSLRERVAQVEAMKKDVDAVRKDVAGLDTVKEKITAITTDLKSTHDDITKLRQDVERNQASDNERKKTRDDQYTKMLDSLKEVDKSLRTVGEKIARIEGATTPMPPEKPKPTENPKPPEGSKPGK